MAVAFCLVLAGCGGSAQPTRAPVTGVVVHGPAAVATPAAPPPGSLDRMLRFHSKRFELSVPLPDGNAWRIDDHSHPELVATHAATRSQVVMAVTREDALMDHARCEERARAAKLVPRGLSAIEDHVGLALEQFDTRVLVAIEPPAAAGAPLVGHVLAFGGFLRKCVFFHYSSEVASADDEAELATRLAVARTRIFDGIELDPFAEVGRESPPHP